MYAHRYDTLPQRLLAQILNHPMQDPRAVPLAGGSGDPYWQHVTRTILSGPSLADLTGMGNLSLLKMGQNRGRKPLQHSSLGFSDTQTPHHDKAASTGEVDS